MSFQAGLSGGVSQARPRAGSAPDTAPGVLPGVHKEQLSGAEREAALWPGLPGLGG